MSEKTKQDGWLSDEDAKRITKIICGIGEEADNDNEEDRNNE